MEETVDLCDVIALSTRVHTASGGSSPLTRNHAAAACPCGVAVASEGSNEGIGVSRRAKVFREKAARAEGVTTPLSAGAASVFASNGGDACVVQPR